jgi:hypothetical protein
MKMPLSLPSRKVTISATGMRVTGQLTFEEWKALAGSLGTAARSIAFIIGDWLVYGQSLFGTDGHPDRRVDPASYQLAVEATGLDVSTLQNYSYVSRSVAYPLRSERLSWEHHRLIAKLPPDAQRHWIEACEAEEEAGRRMTTRRLRKSLNLGRIASEGDLDPSPADKAIDSHIPHINRLSLWWKKVSETGLLETATEEQRAAIRRDLEPVVAIYRQL